MMKRTILIGFVAGACGEPASAPDASADAGPVAGDAPIGDAPQDGEGADAGTLDAPACSLAPAWVAFTMRTPSATENLYAARIDGATAAASVPVNPTFPGDRSFRGYSWAPTGTRLAYIADAEVRTRWELYTVPVGDTLGAAQKVNGYLADGVSVRDAYWWAPDSNHIAYFSDRLFAVDVGGAVPAEPIQVSPEPTSFAEQLIEDPTWAPAGRYLSYPYLKDGLVEIRIADTTDGTIRIGNGPLASGYGAGSPRWRPSGGALAYIEGMSGGDSSHVKIIEVSSGVAGTVNGVMSTAEWVTDLRWSPDGTRLAFMGVDIVAPDVRPVHLYTLDVGSPPYVARVVSGPDDLHEVSFEWSPDSSQLLFEARPGTWRRLYAVPADASALPVEVTSFADDCAYTTRHGWSPALSQAWYLASDCLGLDLYVADLRTWPPGAPRRVSAALPGDRLVEDLAWAPDGRSLVYIADQEENDVYEAFVVAFDDGVPRPPVQLHPPLAPFDPGWGDVLEVAYAADSRRVLFSAVQTIALEKSPFVVEVVDGIPGASQQVPDPTIAGEVAHLISWQPNAGCGP